MAVLTIVLTTGDTIGDMTNQVLLNSTGGSDNTKPGAAANALINYLTKLTSGAGATMQLTTRDTDPSVATSGSGSTQLTFTL